ncbi:MAG: 1-deoxy-D-xylulose-5-phosphate synthase [Bacilli bacterium]|nr:1-deoxy-D-xylulose-5-phosphate synthase [Bacilli bacterium]
MAKKKELKHVNIAEIKDPTFLKEFSYKELDLLSKDICDYIVDMTAINGGHLSSNLGVIDATIAMCRSFDFSQDKLIFDVGHQCYTYKILTGRSLERLRKVDGVSGFQKVSESPYDHFECGHSSTSISVAKGMAVARDLNKEKYEVVAFIGDASIANGLAFEGLNNLNNGDNKVIIILNDNDMSITKPVGGLSKTFRKLSNSTLYRRSKNAYQRLMKTSRFGRWILGWTGKIKNWFKRHVMAMNVFDNMGISYIGPVDGHNIKAMEAAFKKAKGYEKSCIIHIKTIKGKGYKLAENDDSGKWHGVGSFDKETGKLNGDERLVSWSTIYSKAILEEMSERPEAVAVIPATAVGSELQPIFELYPTRSFDVGIAEEHALTMSGGLAASGKHPIISIYSTFLQRAFDELSHDIARMNLNATILIDRAGLVGEDGNTHQGIYDESFLLATPNTVVAMASRESEAYGLFKESFNNHGVFCIRFPRSKLLPIGEKETLSFGKWKKELSGKDTAIISVGPLTLDLKKLLEENKKDVSLYNAIYMKPMDEELISSEIIKNKRVIIYDAYSIENGFAQYLSAKLVSLGYKGKIIIKSIPDVFVDHASISEQLDKFSLQPEDILKLL